MILGPAEYHIGGLGAKGKDTPPQISLAARAKAKQVCVTPAPGDYNVEKAEKTLGEAAPKFTFGFKKVIDGSTETPGRHFRI